MSRRTNRGKPKSKGTKTPPKNKTNPNALMAQMQKMRKQQVTYSYTASITLIISLIFMAIARYFVF